MTGTGATLLLASTLAWGGPNAHTADITSGGNHVCGAVLIQPTVALTAAHCDGDRLNGVRIKTVSRLRAVDLAIVLLEAPALGRVFEIMEPSAPEANPKPDFRSRIRLRQGHSGSPIFQRGKVAAVIVSFNELDRKHGFAVNVSDTAIRRWIEVQLATVPVLE